jgi:hypothetical protein
MSYNFCHIFQLISTFLGVKTGIGVTLYLEEEFLNALTLRGKGIFAKKHEVYVKLRSTGQLAISIGKFKRGRLLRLWPGRRCKSYDSLQG